MFVSLLCKNRTEAQKNEIYEVLGALCHREEIQIEDLGDLVEIYACPQGKIKVTEEDDKIILSANTRHAGAGFHAFSVEFFKALQEEIPGEYDLYDDLNFDQDEDFHRLVHVYEDELEYLRGLLLKQGPIAKMNYIYDETFFLPIENSQRILTSIGDLDIQEFADMHLHDLMDMFYVWNSWQKDAQFYKNAALTLIAKEGAGEYVLMNDKTIKAANTICDYIELAHEQDKTMALPVSQYRYLCQCLDREDLLQDANDMETEVIQYRCKEVYHLFENCKIVANGLCERSYDPVSQSLILMSPYQDQGEWSYLIQASKNTWILENEEEVKESEPKYIGQKNVRLYEYMEDGIYVIEAILEQNQDQVAFHIVCNDEKDLMFLKQCVMQSTFQEVTEG